MLFGSAVFSFFFYSCGMGGTPWALLVGLIVTVFIKNILLISGSDAGDGRSRTQVAELRTWLAVRATCSLRTKQEADKKDVILRRNHAFHQKLIRREKSAEG